MVQGAGVRCTELAEIRTTKTSPNRTPGRTAIRKFLPIGAAGTAMIKLVQINERGYRIGESHQRAKLTDHEVTLLVGLLIERAELIAQCHAACMSRADIDRTLTKARLSYRRIAEAMEVSKRYVRDVDSGRVRCQVAAAVKRVRITEGAAGKVARS